MNVAEISITELADLLEDRKNNTKNNTQQKVALILGSRAGALFRSQRFIDEMSLYTDPRLFVSMNERERFSAYHTLLKKAKELEAGNDLKITLKETIKDINFSIADECMAELVKQELFKMILSFNPDDLLYRAFTTLDLKEKDDFVEFDLDYNDSETANTISSHDKIKACKVIKFFNDVDAFIYKLDKQQEMDSISACVKALLERMRIKEVLVVGIDPTWDSIILSALPPRLKTVWFVNEDEAVKDAFCAACDGLENIRFITGSLGYYEKFIRALCLHLNPDILPLRYELTSRLQNQLNNIQQDLKFLKNDFKNIQDVNSQIQRQITKLSQQVEEAHKYNKGKKD